MAHDDALHAVVKEQIQSLNDAALDVELLTEYTLSLLEKKDHSLEELRSSCESMLEEFLGANTKAFVSKIVAFIEKQGAGNNAKADSGGGKRRRSLSPAPRTRSREHYRERDRPGRGSEAVDLGGYEEDRRSSHRGVREPREPRGRRSERGDDRRSDRDRRGERDRHYDSHRSGRGGRGRGSSDGFDLPPPERKQSKPSPSMASVVVRSVPPEKNNMVDLSKEFEKYGSIVNIRVLEDANTAFVTFKNTEEAEKAIESETPVFNNRHVKVYWARKDLRQMHVAKAKLASQARRSTYNNHTQSGGGSGGGGGAEKHQQQGGGEKEEHKQPIKLPPKGTKMSMSFNTDTETPSAPSVQAAPSAGIIEDTADLEAKRRDILTAQRELQKKILHQLTSTPNLSTEAKTTLMQQLDTLSKGIKVALEREKQEALRRVGAAGRGRGRGRGRGGFPVRGGRGGGRGGYAAPPTAGGFRLDNRSKVLVIQGGQAEIGTHLSNFRNVDSVNFDAATGAATVAFASRRDAEFALARSRAAFPSARFSSMSPSAAPFTPQTAGQEPPSAAQPEVTVTVVEDKEAPQPSPAKESDVFDYEDEDDDEDNWRRRAEE